MDFTFTLSKLYGVMPFKILKENADDVILLINYLNLKEEYEPTEAGANVTPEPAGKEQRIKVNDKTATGGWW